MLLRLAVVALIALIVTVRISAAEDHEHDVLQAARDTLAASGMEILPSSQNWRSNYGSVRVQPDGCASEIALIPFAIMIDASAMQHLVKVKSEKTYIRYFDATLDTQQKIRLFLLLVRQRTLYSFGLSDIYPSETALLVAGSRNCLDNFVVDLSGAWRKQSRDQD